MTKDDDIFEHLALMDPLVEREVEDALMDRLPDRLMELGRGFAFVGPPVRYTSINSPYASPGNTGRPPGPGSETGLGPGGLCSVVVC
jgi:hypothetical protein